VDQCAERPGIDHRSLQAGVSVRYKPLKQYDFFVGAGGWYKSGRIPGTTGCCVAVWVSETIERQAHKTHWNYWQFYADAAISSARD